MSTKRHDVTGWARVNVVASARGAVPSFTSDCIENVPLSDRAVPIIHPFIDRQVVTVTGKPKPPKRHLASPLQAHGGYRALHTDT